MQHPVKLHIVATQREESGLALSSRNMRLGDRQKNDALAIFNCLKEIKSKFKTEDIPTLLNDAEQLLYNSGFSKVDYVTIANAKTLNAITHAENNQNHVALVAAYMGDVRLIDNMLLD